MRCLFSPSKMGFARPIISAIVLVAICLSTTVSSNGAVKVVEVKAAKVEKAPEAVIVPLPVAEKKQESAPAVPAMGLAKEHLRKRNAERVDKINKSQKRWKAKLHHRFADKTQEEMRKLLGVRRTPTVQQRAKRDERRALRKERRKRDAELGLWGRKKKTTTTTTTTTTEEPEPEEDEFDAREEWPECADVIDTIQDQSACGSCWAVSSASVMQDRICIASGGELKVNISSEDILSCEKRSYGCDGGWPEHAFDFWKTKGVCTGSEYADHAGCKPYPFPSDPDHFYSTPRCKHRCENRKYKVKYNKDKHYGLEPVNLQDTEEDDIMEAILDGGPVEADMVVYDDFFHYSEGVYEASPDAEEAGGHAVRIIGWGVDEEEDIPYWLVANSWNVEWGMDGYFMIARGDDECFIESWGINYGDAKLENNTMAARAAERRLERREKFRLNKHPKAYKQN